MKKAEVCMISINQELKKGTGLKKMENGTFLIEQVSGKQVGLMKAASSITLLQTVNCSRILIILAILINL
jgi:hypothetical protein